MDETPLNATSGLLRSGRTKLWLAGLVLALVTAGVFGRVIWHSFAWYDQDTIFNNPKYKPPTMGSILSYWYSPPQQGYYYNPVTYTVWGLLAYGAQHPTDNGIAIDLRPYHAASLVVHIVSSILVLVILYRLLPGSVIPALTGAALFALHPMQVESVAWASGLKDLLASMFSLVAIWQYLRARESESSGGGWIGHYIVASFAFALALLSKPSAVTVPLIAAGLDYFVLRKSIIEVTKRAGPWCIAGLVFAFFSSAYLPRAGLEVAPIWARPLIAGDVLAFYLVKLIAPMRQAPDYGWTPTNILADTSGYLMWMVSAVWCILLFQIRRRAPLLLWGGVVFVMALLPTLGFVSFDFQTFSAVSDHYLYLAMLGAAVAAAWVVQQYGKPGVLVGAAVVLAALSWRSVDQLSHWKTDGELWEHTLEVNPGSYAAMSSLGHSYARRGHIDQAGYRFASALRMRPKYDEAQNNFQTYIAQQQKRAVELINRRRSVEAVAQLTTLLRYNDLLTRIQQSQLGFLAAVALIQLEHYNEGIAELELVLKIRPDYADASKALAIARNLRQKAATRPTTQTTRPTTVPSTRSAK